MIASRTHELRLSPSSLHRGNWYGELAPREPCGSPSTSSDSAVSCAVEADRGSASDARGEDSALRGRGSDALGGEDGGPRGASSAKSASWLRSAWLSSRVKAEEDSTWMRSSPSPSSSTAGGAGESFELYAGEYSTQRPTIYHKNCCGAVPVATFSSF
ncbi:hypothetical protein PC120_g9332 [Phytophthora cactorum]|nr:hypothetical protein PC120_g9332 [Phytophthora cactorum]